MSRVSAVRVADGAGQYRYAERSAAPSGMSAAETEAVAGGCRAPRSSRYQDRRRWRVHRTRPGLWRATGSSARASGGGHSVGRESAKRGDRPRQDAHEVVRGWSIARTTHGSPSPPAAARQRADRPASRSLLRRAIPPLRARRPGAPSRRSPHDIAPAPCSRLRREPFWACNWRDPGERRGSRGPIVCSRRPACLDEVAPLAQPRNSLN